MGQIQLQTGDGKVSIDLLGVGHHVNALRVQLVNHNASMFSESASLASEAKGLAVSISQATSRFDFFFKSLLFQVLKKNIHEVPTLKQKIMKYKGLKQPSFIWMTPAAFYLFVVLVSFFFLLVV